jgi:hypothetical protein
MKRDTVEWLKSLPSPDDDEAWRKRMDDKLHSILFGLPRPVLPEPITVDETLPWDGMGEEA